MSSAEFSVEAMFLSTMARLVNRIEAYAAIKLEKSLQKAN